MCRRRKKRRGNCWLWRADQVGQIVNIYEETAEYVIQTDEYRATDPEQCKYRNGHLVAYELCSAVEGEEGTP